MNPLSLFVCCRPARGCAAAALCMVAAATFITLADDVAAPVAERKEPTAPSVFQFPRIQTKYVHLQMKLALQLRAKQYAEAEQTGQDTLQLIPDDPATYYNIACAQALAGGHEKALGNLRKAIELGFRDVNHMRGDPDLESLRDLNAFRELAELAAASEEKPHPLWSRSIVPGIIRDSVALVEDANTAWDPKNGFFRVVFQAPEQSVRELPVIVGNGEVGELLRGWYAEKTAAGNYGDLYDNHDNDHANLDYENIPQLTRTEYSAEAKASGLHNGLQNQIFFNMITLGNSSTAVTSGPLWRSQARAAQVDMRTVNLQFMHYRMNHLYFYPEHRDYDADHKGDTFPANNSFMIISQGSSGSDKPFMKAAACALAALRPEVKELLAKTGMLIPALQMLFRASDKRIKNPEDYLEGRFHRPVFTQENLDPLKMVTMAHELTGETIPPLAQLEIVDEDKPVENRDFCAAAPNQQVYTTPLAVARVYRTLKPNYWLIVNAGKSADINNLPLLYHWSVLQAPEGKVTIKPLNDSGSLVRIQVDWFEAFSVDGLVSNRIDVALFVHNGASYSPPAIISVFRLANETRKYDSGRITEIDYTGSDYVDPVISAAKDWRDLFSYDPSGSLLGWTRFRGTDQQAFFRDGTLILERDEKGRPLKTQAVRYERGADNNGTPVLRQVPGADTFHFKYENVDSRTGVVERVEPTGAP